MKKETKATEIKGYKGFNSDLKCLNKQYALNSEFKEDKANVCENGMHFCENPLDILAYYPASGARFAEVIGSGNISKKENDEDTKVSCTELKIGAEISLHGIIESGIKFIFERATKTKEKHNSTDKKQSSNSGYMGAASNSGDSGAASNSGYSGAASNSGYMGAASNSGDSGAASNSGYRGAASNSGYMGAASNSGYSGAASNSGYRGAASNSGYSGAASNSGYRGAASNSGDKGAASNSGDMGAAFTIGSYSTAGTNAKESVAVGIGYENKAKANIGSWIVLAERNDNFEILSIQSIKVDGEKIKGDTFYSLKNGEFIIS